MGPLYNKKNIGAGFIVIGSILLLFIIGEFAIKAAFGFIALMCIDHGLKLMGNESLIQMIKRWVKSY